MTCPPGYNVREPTVIYPQATIGKRLTTGHFVLIRGGHIGDDVSIGSYTEIAHDVRIGNRVRIHSMCFICELTVIEDDAWIGPRVTFTNDKWPNFGTKNLQGAIVRRGAIIGANATVLPGVVIGKNAMIGAGAVVTKSVEDSTIVIGNPAEFYKWKHGISDY